MQMRGVGVRRFVVLEPASDQRFSHPAPKLGEPKAGSLGAGDLNAGLTALFSKFGLCRYGSDLTKGNPSVRLPESSRELVKPSPRDSRAKSRSPFVESKNRVGGGRERK